ncbi:MAG: OsmC family protein [Anaerolineae bacterium]
MASEVIEDTMQVKATWVEDLQFTALGVESGTVVALDTEHRDETPRRGTSPMEMLLMGVAGCTGMDVISVLKKKRERVTGFHINVKGYRNTEHPRCYNKVETEYVVRGYNIDPKAVERAIWLSQTKYCSVVNSLKAESVTSFRIEQETEQEQ